MKRLLLANFRLIPLFQRVRKTLDEEQNRPDCTTRAVVSYLNEQVIGLFQLRHTTLLDLGLLNGRFVLRLGERKIDTDEMKRLDDEFRSKLEKRSRLDQIYSKKVSQTLTTEHNEKIEGIDTARHVDPTPRFDTLSQQEFKRPKIDESQDLRVQYNPFWSLI